jgi:hypothetical protein
LQVVGVSADSLDIARGIGERDDKAFSDRRKTGVIDDSGFDPPLSFDARACPEGRQRLANFFAEETRLNHARNRIRPTGKRKKFPPTLQ